MVSIYPALWHSLNKIDRPYIFLLVGYVEERLWWPIQAPTNEERRKRKAKRNIYMCSHHHHIGRVARAKLTISLHSSLSFIALGRSANCTLVSSVSSFWYVLTGLTTLAFPCLGFQMYSTQGEFILLKSSLYFRLTPHFTKESGMFCFVNPKQHTISS